MREGILRSRLLAGAVFDRPIVGQEVTSKRWAVIGRPYKQTGNQSVPVVQRARANNPADGLNKAIRFCCLILILTALGACSKPPELLVYGAVSDFSFTSQDSHPVTRADLDGKVWIADFIFTGCSGLCPAMTSQMRRLQDKLPSEIHFVSFSVDPAHDTPEALSAYARANGADSSRWVFLTGDKEALYSLSMKTFKLAVDDTVGTPAEPVTHSSRFVLVDKEGNIRGYYGIEDEGAMDRLTADAQRLL